MGQPGVGGQKRKGRGGDHEKRGEEAGGKQLSSSEAAWAGGQRRSPLPTRLLGAQQSANPDIELLCDWQASQILTARASVRSNFWKSVEICSCHKDGGTDTGIWRIKARNAGQTACGNPPNSQTNPLLSILLGSPMSWQIFKKAKILGL